MPKILLFDIETAPNLAHVWSFFKENTNDDKLLQDGYIMSFAAKWLGESDVIYQECRNGKDKSLVKRLIGLIDEADIIVGHNGERFDYSWVRSKGAIYGMPPPSPVKVVDTYKEAKKHFYFPSYRLSYLTRVFGLKDQKSSHKLYPGHQLWMACLNGDDAAWEELREYNIKDVFALEGLYKAMLPWISNHPNHAVYSDSEELVCTKCGSKHVHRRGYYRTNVSKFARYQCQDCGGWSRSRYNEASKEKMRSTLTNAL